MKTTLNGFLFFLLLLPFVCSSSAAHVVVASALEPSPKPLATKRFNLKTGTEVGLEIEARSPGASWA
ncbi:MAG TPA: hypothetical protein VMS31_23230, partial [Pyrinomonadaceae bacterium]|nr:hypothetical protein [Pyrinomonadaceae bacterium]